MSKVDFIQLSAYNPDWPRVFSREASVIKNSLQNLCLNVYHVGSTSVPGLIAKPVIDMIVTTQYLKQCIPYLESLGYIYKGELNIPFRLYFIKQEEAIAFHIHLCEPNNPEIELNRSFSEYLRRHSIARAEYAALKMQLIQDQACHQETRQGLRQYTLGKDAFIRKTLALIGFNQKRLLFCAHYLEWNTYHRICEEQIFRPLDLTYDRQHPTLTDPNHYFFIVCQGVTIVSAAHIEFLNAKEAALRALATDTPYQRKGYATYLMNQLERWVRFQGQSVFKMHANLKTEPFYRSLGYQDMTFDESSINPCVINLGKIL